MHASAFFFRHCEEVRRSNLSIRVKIASFLAMTMDCFVPRNDVGVAMTPFRNDGLIPYP